MVNTMGFFDTLGKIGSGIGSVIIATAEVVYANSTRGKLEAILKQVRACDMSVEDAISKIEDLFEKAEENKSEFEKMMDKTSTSSYSTGMGSSYSTNSSIRDSIIEEWAMAKKPLQAKYQNKLDAGLTLSAGHVLDEIKELNKKYEARLRAL
jgi:hypothetical protein